ncbi:MAG: type 1 glutamine amidotransferase [bacterium]
MRILIIQNCETEGLGHFIHALAVRGIEFDVCHPYEDDTYPSPVAYDAMIVGGTPMSVCDIEEHAHLLSERTYVAEALEGEVKVLGVCFGAQLLAHILGAEVRPNPVKEIGMYEVQLTEEGKADPIFGGFPESFPVFQWHGDTFDLPGGASLLATGKNCRNQAFRKDNAIGVQFHLEAGAEDAERWAEVYAEELAAFGKTKKQVMEECANQESAMNRLAGLLLENFLGIE